MHDDSILDAPSEEEIKQQLKDENVKYLRIIGMLLVANIVLTFTVGDLSLTDIWVFYYLFYGLISGTAFLGFLIGLAFANVPYKNLDYNKRYTRASLICVAALYVLQIIGWLVYALLNTTGLI